MSYYSDKKYKEKMGGNNLWFEKIYFDRWFKNSQGPILDIGCATGNFMAVKPEIFEGIEKDKDSVEIAQKRGLKVFEMDIEKDTKALPAEKYEGIYAKQIIEHLNNPLDFLKEIKRILKPGGQAVLYTPNCPYMLNKGFWDDYTHKRPFTRSALKRIAYDAGFKKAFVFEDFRCFPGLGGLMRLLHLSPAAVARFQRIFFIRGLSLILVLEKE